MVKSKKKNHGYRTFSSYKQNRRVKALKKFKSLTLPGKMKTLGKSAAKDLRRASDVVMVAAQIAGTTSKMIGKVISFKGGDKNYLKKSFDGFYKARLDAITKKIKI